MHWERFKSDDLRSLRLQAAQAWMGGTVGESGYGEALVAGGPSYTLRDGDRALVCAGIVHIWAGRAQAWSLVSGEAGRHFVRVVRGLARFLDAQDVVRIETAVDVDFAAGHRMVRLLGFEREGRMRSYLRAGMDCDLYARVK